MNSSNAVCWFCGRPDSPWLSVKHVANLLGLSEVEVRRQCRVGLIRAEKVMGFGQKGHWRITPDDAIRRYEELHGTSQTPRSDPQQPQA